MKKLIIGWVLDAVFEAMLKALKNLAVKTSSKVDDKLVAVLVKEQDAIKVDLVRQL